MNFHKTKKIVILGSTGSIGESALKVLRSAGNGYKVVGLTTESNIHVLARQVETFKPRCVGIVNPTSCDAFTQQYKQRFSAWGLRIYRGPESLQQVATEGNADLILSGVVGAAGLPALLASLRKGLTVALANKESLIMAGPLVMKTAKKYGARVLPVDSEHSAMFQCLQGQNGNAVEKIILTASGGPFYRYSGNLSKVSVQKALAHPNWKMGKKITIDSATLMNKGLEKIEAHLLFGVPLDKIQIVIHRQSIIHSAVEFVDGSILAQLSVPDMCLPIQYALTYPERRPAPIQKLNLTEVGRLDFEEPDFKRFPCLSLALQAARSGGTMPAVLSASNECAVYAFLRERICFTDIAKVVDKVMRKHSTISNPDLNQILEADSWSRRTAQEIIDTIGR
ncbi:MAG: 1-deoxy-D-xylulose-5-phosphate reductoisomerase [Elusimicrobia bacterium]|nr:1-deoxy-D-xylulose-5-phosphate reductoisomerase [Elusimicrobiota bacterium]